MSYSANIIWIRSYSHTPCHRNHFTIHSSHANTTSVLTGFSTKFLRKVSQSICFHFTCLFLSLLVKVFIVQVLQRILRFWEGPVSLSRRWWRSNEWSTGANKAAYRVSRMLSKILGLTIFTSLVLLDRQLTLFCAVSFASALEAVSPPNPPFSYAFRCDGVFFSCAFRLDSA